VKFEQTRSTSEVFMLQSDLLVGYYKSNFDSHLLGKTEKKNQI